MSEHARYPIYVLLAIALVTVGLTGCLGSEDGPLESSAAPTDPPVPRTPTFPNGTAAPLGHEIRSCEEVVHVQPVPVDVLEPRVPAGFTIVPFDPTGELGTVLMVGQSCTWGDGSQVAIAKVYLMVDPPDAWENPDASGHALYLTVMTDSEGLADLLTAWGLGPVVSVGDVTLELTTTPGGGAGHLDASAAGDSLTIDTLVAGQPTAGTGPVTRMFVADETLTVTGAVDLVPSEHEGELQGASRVSFSGIVDDGGPLPAYPALGHQLWGFGQTESYVELPALEGPR